MEVLKQLRKRFENVNNSVSRWAVGLMFLFMVAAPIELEAQSGLKISSLSEVTDTAKEGADTILDVAKYILAAVLGIALVFVIYSLATNNPHAKEYLLGWIIAVVVIMVAFLIISAMRTMRKINKPIKFFGLSSGQFGIFMLIVAITIIVCIFKQLHPLVITLLLSGIVFLSGLLFNTLKKEHKAGNPDFLTGLSVRSATPRKIVDKKKIFNFILN